MLDPHLERLPRQHEAAAAAGVPATRRCGSRVADEPDVVCLQELPAWALPRSPRGAATRRCPRSPSRRSLGPLPSTAKIGRAVTSLHAALLRSAFSGQGNAILVAPRLAVSRAARVRPQPARLPARAGASGSRLGPLARARVGEGAARVPGRPALATASATLARREPPRDELSAGRAAAPTPSCCARSSTSTGSRSRASRSRSPATSTSASAGRARCST